MLLGLLRTILFILLFYYVFKFIGRLLIPLFLKKGMERFQQQQQDAANSYKQRAKQKEGTVTVQQAGQTPKETPVQDNVGEYVDFEEVN